MRSALLLVKRSSFKRLSLCLTFMMNACFYSRWLGAACFYLCLSSVAVAQGFISQKAWLEDPSNALTWEQVQQRETELTPYKGVLSRGFGSSTIWIRLRIDPQIQNPTQSQERLVMRIRPVYLDQITLYDPLHPEGPTGVTGDHWHPMSHEFEGLDFMLPVERGAEPRDLWLRLQSTSTRQIAIKLVTLEELTRQVHSEELLFSLYVGVIMVFMAWAFVHWLFSLEALVGAFAMAQFCALVYTLCALGYARAFWPADWPALWLNYLTSVFSVLAVSSATYFHVLHVREFSPPRWMQALFKGLLWFQSIKLGLFLGGLWMAGLTLNMVEILISPTLFLMSVVFARGWSKEAKAGKPLMQRHFIVGFYALLWGIMMVAVLPALAIADGGEIPLYIVQAHGLVSAFLILVMLQFRDRVLRRQQNEVRLSLERSELQMQHEKNIREEQQKLLAMLAHELKTPLSTMHMRLPTHTEGGREIRQAIRDMDGVIERCVQTLRFSDQKLQVQPVKLNLYSVVKDVISSCSQPERIQWVGPSQLELITDRQLLSILLNNLIENACKYADPDEPIQIRAHAPNHAPQSEGRVSIEVINLPGPAGRPDPEKVFEKYYRSPGARRQAGTGLGLYLVKNLAQAMNSTIDYRPDATHIRFVLSLPQTL